MPLKVLAWEIVRMQLLLIDMEKGGEKFIYHYSAQIKIKLELWQRLLCSLISYFASKEGLDLHFHLDTTILKAK